VDTDFGTKFRLLAVAARLAHIDRLTAIGSSSSPQLRVGKLDCDVFGRHCTARTHKKQISVLASDLQEATKGKSISEQD
jgi:hypothetical protein